VAFAERPETLEDHTPRLLETLLPEGGLVVALVEAYFDESGTNADSPYLVVAGYIFERDRCAAMVKKWGQLLEDFQLPYFRMSQCNARTGPFKRLSECQCIEVATEAADLIKTHAIRGVAFSVEKAYFHHVPRYDFYDSPYTFACWQALLSVRRWMDENSFFGDAAYFFEAGHESESEAAGVMAKIFAQPYLKSRYRAVGYSFGEKRRVRPLQAADILAWHWHKDLLRRDKGLVKHRGDFSDLLVLDHWAAHYDRARLIEYPDWARKNNEEFLAIARRYSRGYKYY